MAKGMWQPLSSPLVRNLTDGKMPALMLPPRAPLAELPPAYDAESLRRTVAALADPALEGRGLGCDGLARATATGRSSSRIGWASNRRVTTGFRQSWRWTGGEPEREMELVNLVARIPGQRSAVRRRAGSGHSPTSTISVAGGRMCARATRARSTPGPTTTPPGSPCCSSSRGPWRPNRRDRARWSLRWSPVRRRGCWARATSWTRCPPTRAVCLRQPRHGRPPGRRQALRAQCRHRPRVALHLHGCRLHHRRADRGGLGAPRRLRPGRMHRKRSARPYSSSPGRPRIITDRPTPSNHRRRGSWWWSPRRRTRPSATWPSAPIH